MNWLTPRDEAKVAITAVRPSSSGRPAATSAPKASSRMMSVSGSDSVSAFLRSSANIFVDGLAGARVAELLDAELGLRLLRRRGGREDGSTLSWALSTSPLISKLTTTGGRLGDLALVALGVRGLDRRHAGLGAHGGDDVADGGPNLRPLGGAALGRLDEDVLLGLVSG